MRSTDGPPPEQCLPGRDSGTTAQRPSADLGVQAGGLLGHEPYCGHDSRDAPELPHSGRAHTRTGSPGDEPDSVGPRRDGRLGAPRRRAGRRSLVGRPRAQPGSAVDDDGSLVPGRPLLRALRPAVYWCSGRTQISTDSLWRGFRSTAHCYSGCGAGEVLGFALFAWLLALQSTLVVTAGTFALAYTLGYALTVGPSAR